MRGGPPRRCLLTRFGTLVFSADGTLRHAAPPTVLGEHRALDWPDADPASTDPAVRLERAGAALVARRDGSFAPAGPGEQGEARLLALSEPRLREILALSECGWLLSDGGRLAAGEIRIGEDFALHMGAWRVALDQGEAVLQVTQEAGRPGTVRVLHDGWRVGLARRYQPLIYLCVFGADRQFSQLELFLRSLDRHGDYDGDLLVVSDRSEAQLAPLVPRRFAGRLRVVRREPATVFAMLNARYDLDDLPIEAFQPVLYLDSDIICDAPVAPLLEIMARRPALYGAIEHPDRTVASLVKFGGFFGKFLFEKDPLPDNAAKCVNSGSIGFSNKEAAQPVFRQMQACLDAYLRQETDFELRWTDQPFFGYAIQRAGGADLETMNRFIRLVWNQQADTSAPTTGLVHFNNGVAAASKLDRMAQYLAHLEARPREATRAPAIVINRAIPGQMTDEELGRLCELAAAVPPGGVIVEVGSLYGLSSWHLAKHAAPGVRVFCIDPWRRAKWIVNMVEGPQNAPPFSRQAFDAFTADCPNITAIEGESPAIAAGWSLPVDLYFDDAMHANPVLEQNIAFWSAQVRPGGVVSGHDYTRRWPDVVAAADGLARRYGTRVEVTGTVWSVVKAASPGRGGAD